MFFKLETPEHQRTAIRSVVEVFRGMEKNTYDNATDEDIRANVCSPLSLDALMANIGRIAADNGIEASYKASVREYSTFKARAGQTIINQANE